MMKHDALAVLQAVAILHSPSVDAVSRRQADQWLQTWRSSPSSWRTCLQLLLQPGVQLADTDRYFFACCLRFACQKSSGDLLDPAALGSVIDQASVALLDSVLHQTHAVTNQLSSALAALAVRSQNWEASRIILDCASLFQRTAQKLRDSSSSDASCIPLDLVPCLSLLSLMQSLATEARNKQCSVHPGRRTAVTAAMSTSPEPIRWVRLALAVQGPHAAACSLQALNLLEEYCNLGTPPVGLDSHEDLLAAICQRVLKPETAKAAAQCLAAACTAAGPEQPRGGGGAASALGVATAMRPRAAEQPSHTTDLKLFFLLLQHWQASGYSPPRPSSHSPTDHSDPNAAPPAFPAEVTLAACTVLSATCTVLLRPALSPSPVAEQASGHARSPLGPAPPVTAEMRIQQASIVGFQHYFRLVADQLLLHLQHRDDEVALVAASFFSCTYLPELKAALLPSSSSEHRKALLDQHAPLLQRLTESLILRTQLRPEVAAVATADARDIPDDARTVRRELAGMLCDISSLVGHTAMLQFMSALVQPGYLQLDAGAGAGGHGQGQVHSWVRLECALYAANVVMGRWVSETWNAGGKQGPLPLPSAARRRPQLRRMGAGLPEGGHDEDDDDVETEDDEDMDDDEDEEDEEEMGGEGGGQERVSPLSGRPSGSGSAGSGSMPPPPRRQASRSTLPGGSAEADLAVAQLVEIAAMSSVHPEGSCKLAGTALTLLGGLSSWYAEKVIPPTHQTSKAAATAALQAAPTPPSAQPPQQPSSAAPLRSRSSPLGEHGSGQEPASNNGSGGNGGPKLPGGVLKSAAAAAAAGGAYARSHSSPLDQSDGDAGAQPSKASPLPSVLLAVLQAIQSEDSKLSRNGATTLQRLCAHEGLARHLLAHHSSWVDTLVNVYQKRGGMVQRAGPHEDSSTEELLLMTLCRLACLSGGHQQLLLHLATPQVQALQMALAELLAASDSVGGPSGLGSPLYNAVAGLTCAGLVGQCTKSLDVLTAIMESCRLGGRGSAAGGKGGKGGASLLGGQGAGVGGKVDAEAAAAGAAAEQVLGLMRAVWWVLQQGLQPKLLQTQGAELSAAVSTFMAAALKTFTAASRAFPGARAGGSAGSQPLLAEPAAWAMSLLEVIPVLLLSTPRIVDLLLACLDALAELQRLQLSPAGAAAGGGGSAAPGGGAAGTADLPALTNRLGTVAGGALVAGFANLVNPLASQQADSQHTSSLLRLCCSCMTLLPSCFVLSNSTPDLMLSATLVACYSLDMDQCRAAMDWCQCLCTRPFGGACATAPSAAAAAAVAPPPPLSPAAAAAHAALRTWLDGTAGAKVVQALLLSASGSMPSCLVLPVSTALHRIWRGIGTERFLRWADMALLMLVPAPPSPWQHLKPEHRTALLRDLVSAECASDVPRFKRVVKSLCGGKRKGENGTGGGGGGGHSGGRTATRGSSSSRSLGQEQRMGGGMDGMLRQLAPPQRVRSLSRESLMPMQQQMGGLLGVGLGMNAMAQSMNSMNSLNSMNSMNSMGGMNAMGQGMSPMSHMGNLGLNGMNSLTQSMNAMGHAGMSAMGQSLLQQASPQQLLHLAGIQQLSMGLQQQQVGPGGYQQQPDYGAAAAAAAAYGSLGWMDVNQGHYGMLLGGTMQAQAQYGGGLPLGVSPQGVAYLQQQQQQQQQQGGGRRT